MATRTGGGTVGAKGARSVAQEEAIRGYFEGLPVVESKNPIRIFVKDQDKEGAVRKDPRNCVYSRACQRQFGSTAALFFRSVAYVDIPDESGTFRVERFGVSKGTRRQIEAFDKGIDSVSGGFHLMATAGTSMSSEKTKKANKKYRRTRKAILHGRAAVLRVKRQLAAAKGLKTRSIIKYDGVRDGTGMVHFTKLGPSAVTAA